MVNVVALRSGGEGFKSQYSFKRTPAHEYSLMALRRLFHSSLSLSQMKRRKVKAKRRKPRPTGDEGEAVEEVEEVEEVAQNGTTSAPYSVDDLLDRAEALMDEVELETAQRFCLRALEMEASNVRALELCGLLLLESGGEREAEARFCFARVAELSPQPHHSVLLYLAQLSEGQEAVDFTEKAIALMRARLAESEEAGAAATETPRWRHKAPTWRDVSNAHCAIGELFMTDLCDAEGAEERCTSALEAALTADGQNPEALHLRASLHLVKGEVAPAKALMTTAVPLWLPGLRAALEKGQEGGEEAEGPADLTEASGLTFESRVKAAQTLLEVELLEEAAEVLESCSIEDDEDLQVLYLSCVVHFRLWERVKAREGEAEGEEEEEEEEEAAENARAFIRSGLELLKGKKQKEMEGHLKEMLEALGSAGKSEDDIEEVPESSGDEEEEEEKGMDQS